MIDPKEQLEHVWRRSIAKWRPAERRIYKLKQKPPLNGQALKLNLRLEPAFNGDFISIIDGGLFCEIAPQAPTLNEKGYPTVEHDAPTRVVAKLGVPDVSGLVAAYEAVRLRHQPVPVYLRKGKKLEDKKAAPTNLATFFHDTGDGTNTVITWEFREDDSVLRMSKSKPQTQQITLTVGEEVVLYRYLLTSLDAMLEVGY